MAAKNKSREEEVEVTGGNMPIASVGGKDPVTGKELRAGAMLTLEAQQNIRDIKEDVQDLSEDDSEQDEQEDALRNISNELIKVNSTLAKISQSARLTPKKDDSEKVEDKDDDTSEEGWGNDGPSSSDKLNMLGGVLQHNVQLAEYNTSKLDEIAEKMGVYANGKDNKGRGRSGDGNAAIAYLENEKELKKKKDRENFVKAIGTEFGSVMDNGLDKTLATGFKMIERKMLTSMAMAGLKLLPVVAGIAAVAGLIKVGTDWMNDTFGPQIDTLVKFIFDLPGKLGHEFDKVFNPKKIADEITQQINDELNKDKIQDKKEALASGMYDEAGADNYANQIKAEGFLAEAYEHHSKEKFLGVDHHDETSDALLRKHGELTGTWDPTSSDEENLKRARQTHFTDVMGGFRKFTPEEMRKKAEKKRKGIEEIRAPVRQAAKANGYIGNTGSGNAESDAQSSKLDLGGGTVVDVGKGWTGNAQDTSSARGNQGGQGPFKSQGTITPTAIMLHHTGGGTLESNRKTLQDKGYGYHYMIDSDAKAIQMMPDTAKLSHAGETEKVKNKIGNQNAIGISLVAEDDESITKSQVEAAIGLTNMLMNKYNISSNRVLGHGEATGRKLPTEGLTVVKQVRGNKEIQLDVPTNSDATSNNVNNEGGADGGGETTPNLEKSTSAMTFSTNPNYAPLPNDDNTDFGDFFGADVRGDADSNNSFTFDEIEVKENNSDAEGASTSPENFSVEYTNPEGHNIEIVQERQAEWVEDPNSPTGWSRPTPKSQIPPKSLDYKGKVTAGSNVNYEDIQGMVERVRGGFGVPQPASGSPRLTMPPTQIIAPSNVQNITNINYHLEHKFSD